MANYLKLLRTARALKAAQYWPLEKIKHVQLKKFQRILHHAYEHVPMYTTLYDAQGFSPDEVREYTDIENKPRVSIA